MTSPTQFTAVFLLCLLLNIIQAIDERYSNKWGGLYLEKSRERQGKVCDLKSRYRTADGSCNNPNNPAWGATLTPFDRIVYNAYHDEVNLPRKKDSKGELLPSARLVSLKCHKPNENRANATLMLMQFGQFLDHDITLTAKHLDIIGSHQYCSCYSNNHDRCFAITLPQEEDYYKSKKCLEFTRSSYIKHKDSTTKGKKVRQQLNVISSFIDGTNLYGSSPIQLERLKGKNGRLATTRYGKYPMKGLSKNCNLKSGEYCFKTGDFRVNEQPGLTVLNTIFIRQHNLIADEFKRKTKWDDETIFQETRKIMEAIIQRITYYEFLPLLLTPKDLKRFKIMDEPMKFDPKVDPRIFNSFATAAYRFGHTLIPDNMFLDGESTGCPLDKGNSDRARRSTSKVDKVVNLHGITKRNTDDIYEHLGEHVSLAHNYFSPTHVFTSFDKMAAMLTTEKSMKLDGSFSHAISRHLRRMEVKGETDLVSLNIQRGRDHGLAPYNEYRQICGLRRLKSLDELFKGNKEAQLVYKSIDDVDLYTGGTTEAKAEGGLLGPTFSCLIAYQFYKLKYGDRFFYLNSDGHGLFKEQIAEINKMTLSKVMCAATRVKTYQENAFLPESSTNPQTCCEKMEGIDLSKWTKYTQKELNS